MMRSLRGRLLLGTVLATMAVFVVAAGILYGALRSTLVAEFDNGLAAKAQSLANLTEQDKRGVKMNPGPLVLDARTGTSQDHFAVWDERGRLVAQSAWQGGMDGLAELRVYNKHGRVSFTRLQDGRRGRRIVLLFTPVQEDDEAALPLDNAHRACLVLIRETHGLDQTLSQLAWVLAAVFALTTVVSAASMAWVVRRGLIPLNTLADRIHAIGAMDLSERIALDEGPQEMTPVVTRVNGLLVNVESALARERTFTADVAHELRTPLAGLTAALEVCSSRQRQAHEYEQVIAKCLKAARGMHAMVENLLIVARADANQLRPQYEQVDLGQLLQEGWCPFEGQVACRRLTVNRSVPCDLFVEADRGLLRIVIRNLFDNAVSYADGGGVICIEGRRDGDRIVLRIANTGSQVPVEQAADVFRRFWRGDAARSEAGQHCGLGLALCKRIVVLLRGAIAIDTVAGGTFSVTLQLPAKP
jgi:two-component system, OmpR family, heavy metal sensor histidine kinase CusS